jgi:hypothetical protein
VKERKALAEYLGFVISLDPQSLSRMERSKTLLQFAQNIFFHPVMLILDEIRRWRHLISSG